MDLSSATGGCGTTQPTDLADLPQELLDIIVDYLPLNSKISLKISCQKFYALGFPLPTLIDQVLGDTDLRFELFCMNEREPSELPRTRLVCSAWKRLHDLEVFMPEETPKNTKERKCIGRQRRACVTAEISLSLEEMVEDFWPPENEYRGHNARGSYSRPWEYNSPSVDARSSETPHEGL